MFTGRAEEIAILEQTLVQTRADQPKHFMVTGERGIGKTSLLDYIRWVASGAIGSVGDDQFNFLVVDLDVEKGTTSGSLARKIERALRHELGKTEPARDFLAKTWNFVQRIEAGGIALHSEVAPAGAEDVLDELAYSLSKTVDRITKDGLGGPFSAHFDGVLILIDEADNASKDLDLGSVLKLLTERLQKRGCSRVMLGLAGLPDLRNVLRESHPSVLRIFDDVSLRRLSEGDAARVIDRALEMANKKNEENIRVHASILRPCQTVIGTL
jgi:Cdc6-like AAA superfamily ATPase